MSDKALSTLVPQDLHTELGVYAKANGLKVRYIVEKALRDYLQAVNK